MAFTGAAKTVIARLFRLVMPTGEIAADFDASDPSVGDSPSLVFYHNTTHQSRLWWGRSAEPSFHTLNLASPNSRATIEFVYSDAANSGQITIAGLDNGSSGGFVTVTPTDVSIQAVNDIALNPGLNDGVTLNTRQAYMTVVVGNAVASGGLALNAGYQVVPGLTSGALTLKAGDRVYVSASVTVTQPAGGTEQLAFFVNGAQLTIATLFGVTGGTCSVPVGPGWYTVPANGNYTFDVRALSSGGGVTTSVFSAMTYQVIATT